jgi:hypothetical protein
VREHGQRSGNVTANNRPWRFERSEESTSIDDAISGGEFGRIPRWAQHTFLHDPSGRALFQAPAFSGRWLETAAPATRQETALRAYPRRSDGQTFSRTHRSA